MKIKNKKCSINFKIQNNFPPLETSEKKKLLILLLKN